MDGNRSWQEAMRCDYDPRRYQEYSRSALITLLGFPIVVALVGVLDIVLNMYWI